MNPIKRRFCPPTLILIALATGCETSNERLVEVAREASQQQAEQNRQIAHQNHQLAEASNELIKADAQSRQELIALERGLQTERAVVGRQRDALESERRTLVQERLWDSRAGNAIGGAATLLVAALPLILCWFVLRGMWLQDNDDALGEILIQEVLIDPTADMPQFIEGDEGGRLPPPGSEELDRLEEDRE